MLRKNIIVNCSQLLERTSFLKSGQLFVTQLYIETVTVYLLSSLLGSGGTIGVAATQQGTFDFEC